MILVVDDDQELRETVCGLLSRAGIEAAGAGDGAEALAYLARAEVLPSLILLDLMMPVMSGWEFCSTRDQDPRLQSIPVVAFTASRDTSRLPPHIDGVLLKPARLEQLMAIVREHDAPSANDAGT